MAKTLAQSRIDTDALPPVQRLAHARDYYHGVCDVAPAFSGAPFTAQGRVWRLGDCFVNRARHGPMRLRHTNRVLKADYRIVRYVTRGGFTPLANTATDAVDPSALTLGACTDLESVAGFDYACIRAPMDVIAHRRRADPVERRVVRASPHGRVLHALFFMLVEGVEGDGPASRLPALDEIGALFRLMAAPPDKGDAAGQALYRKARRLAMTQFVDAYLGMAELDRRHLEAAFGVSRATLFRVFDADGGVGAAIAQRRLARAWTLLAASAPARGLIGRTAEAVGYPDSAHFCRAFKQRFGIVASDVVGAERTSGAAALATAPRRRQRRRLTDVYAL